MAGSAPGPIDYENLAEFLAALGYPLRLELLDILRFPHALGELRVSPRRREGGKAVGRPAARQTVQVHLDKLLEADLVRTLEREGAGPPRYLVHAPKLYELTEELRRLSVRYAGRGPGGDATGTLAGGATPDDVPGPKLLLVHGVYEGKSFPLDKASAPSGQWIVGRRRDAAISLDYDPFVSMENAVITGQGGRFTVTDLGSKNGTSVNWSRMASGTSRALKASDVIGVGRSLLSFVPA